MNKSDLICLLNRKFAASDIPDDVGHSSKNSQGMKSFGESWIAAMRKKVIS